MSGWIQPNLSKYQKKLYGSSAIGCFWPAVVGHLMSINSTIFCVIFSLATPFMLIYTSGSKKQILIEYFGQ
jgi:hypothetical protein